MKRNITFIHIPKCGGTSIGAMDLCGRVHYFGHDIRNKNFQYFKDSDQRKLSEFSFTFVRNPWDRLVSAYEYLKAGESNYGDQKDFLHFFSHFKSFEDLILNWDDIFLIKFILSNNTNGFVTITVNYYQILLVKLRIFKKIFLKFVI